MLIPAPSSQSTCVSFRANSVTWNPHKMMGVLLQCSAILVREKVCTPSRDELLACVSFRRHQRAKHRVLLQCWAALRRQTSPWDHRCCPPCALSVSLWPTPASPGLSLAAALGTPSVLRALSETQTARAVFHFTLLMLYKQKGRQLECQLSPQNERVVTGTYFNFLA